VTERILLGSDDDLFRARLRGALPRERYELKCTDDVIETAAEGAYSITCAACGAFDPRLAWRGDDLWD